MDAILALRAQGRVVVNALEGIHDPRCTEQLIKEGGPLGLSASGVVEFFMSKNVVVLGIPVGRRGQGKDR